MASQTLVDQIRVAHHAPGLAVAVMHQGGQVALVSGHASIGLKVPVSDRTLFHLGSVGKHITAVAALRLVEAGKLALDAPIGRYAPRLPSELADRPFRSLLDHASGLPDYSPAIEWDRPFDRDTFYRLMRTYPIEFPAGAAWNYSNAAYVLIGYVIEDIAGKTYARIVGEDLFPRCGARDSRVDDAELPITDRAEPYEWHRDHHVHAKRMSSTVSSVAAGGVLMSMRDVAGWTRALHGGALLPANSLAEMARPTRLATGREIPYGLGWMLDRMPNGDPILYHGGSVPGFRTLHVHLPRRELSVMAVTNGDSLAASVAGWQLAELHSPGATPLSLPSLADAAPLSTRQARSIVTRDGRLDATLFAPELQLHLAAGRDHVVPRFPPEQCKALRAFELVQTDNHPDGTSRRRYRATFTDHSRHLAVHHLDNGRIYFLRIQ
jgi:CubicO group peptidase (beta-lactamase class C family)